MSPPEVVARESAQRQTCECGGAITAAGECAKCKRKRGVLQRRASTGQAPDLVSAIVHDVLDAPGAPLDPETRRQMESRFRTDFAGVRVHTDATAGASAEALAADAYAVGSSIAFAPGRYDPRSTAGTDLLAHELAHVVQQRTHSPFAPRLTLAPTDDPAEHAANAAATAAIRGARVAPQPLIAAPRVARKPTASPTAPPLRMEVQAGPGTVTVTFDRSPILTVRYDAKNGAAKTDHYRPDNGPETVFVTFPLGANMKYSLDPRYNQLYSSGELAFNQQDPELADDTFAEVAGSAIGLTGRRPAAATKPAPPKPTPARPAGSTAHVPPTAAPATPPPEGDAATTAPVKPPPRTPAALIDANTTLGFLDEDRLGNQLLDYALAGDSQTVDGTLDALGSTDRDDVAAALTQAATPAQLARLAETEEGRKLLLRLYDELTSGHLGDDEAEQADRILKARLQRGDPASLAKADDRAMIIPFSSIGFTKLSSASLTVKRLPNGKIWVKSFMKPEHWADAKRLPQSFVLGLDGMELDPDQIIGLHLYDEGGQEVFVPAIYLLQLGNQEDTRVYTMAGEAVVTGLTLGAGPEVAAGAEAVEGATTAQKLARGGAQLLATGDRVAAGLSVASTLINEHRGLIISTFGDDGRDFLKQWQKVDRVLAVYGLARGAVALGQTASALRGTIQTLRARRATLRLAGKDAAAVDGVISESESSLAEIEKANKSAVTQDAKAPGQAGGPDHPPADGGPPAATSMPPARSAAEEAATLKRSGLKPAIGDLDPGELEAELDVVRRTAPKPSTEGGYVGEVELPQPAGERHTWRAKADGTWCRFSKPGGCLPPSRVRAQQGPAAAAGSGVAPKRVELLSLGARRKSGAQFLLRDVDPAELKASQQGYQVYEYYTADGECLWVGKSGGAGGERPHSWVDRGWEHIRDRPAIAEADRVVVRAGLTEQEAFALEQDRIAELHPRMNVSPGEFDERSRGGAAGQAANIQSASKARAYTFHTDIHPGQR
jgi:hypothetical protein